GAGAGALPAEGRDATPGVVGGGPPPPCPHGVPTLSRCPQAGLARCQREAEEVAELMRQNVAKALEREGHLEQLQSRAQDLRQAVGHWGHEGTRGWHYGDTWSSCRAGPRTCARRWDTGDMGVALMGTHSLGMGCDIIGTHCPG
uniref:V-SNARE coiled-coil homology domain-containing protein n=1 Tax=Taeniopygia guttata TaxID=59729 RepID=A0A674GRS8_TAEGU